MVVVYMQFVVLIGVFEYLVDQQNFFIVFLKFIGEIDNVVFGEVEVVYVDKEV